MSGCLRTVHVHVHDIILVDLDLFGDYEIHIIDCSVLYIVTCTCTCSFLQTFVCIIYNVYTCIIMYTHGQYI